MLIQKFDVLVCMKLTSMIEDPKQNLCVIAMHLVMGW